MGSYNTTGVLQKPAASAGKAEDANAGVKIDPSEISKLDALQMLLDVIGLVPGFGAPADLLNGLVSAMRGDWWGAGLSLVGVVPIAGEAATAAKIAKNSERYLAGVRKVADEIVPHLPEGMQKPIKEAIEAAEKKIDELAGKTRKAEEAEAAPKPTGEKGEGAKSKPKKKMKCGESGSYGDLKKKTGDGKFDRDHIPSKAALKERAAELKGEPLSAAEKRAIDNGADAIAIPRQAHIDHSPTHGQSIAEAAKDAKDLAGSAARDIAAMLDKIDEYDADGGCKDAYKKASDAILKKSNKDYDDWLEKLISGD